MSNAVNAPIDLRDRTLQFSRNVIVFVKKIRIDPVAWSISDQVLRSSTSIGANFIEAKNASSKKDFRNKVFISKKEASETLYWLKLCEEFGASSELNQLQKECQEIILILQAIISRLNH